MRRTSDYMEWNRDVPLTRLITPSCSPGGPRTPENPLSPLGPGLPLRPGSPVEGRSPSDGEYVCRLATAAIESICNNVTVCVLRPVTTLKPGTGTCSIHNNTLMTSLTFLAPRPWWPRSTSWQRDSRNAERVFIVVDVEAVAAALKLSFGHDIVSWGRRE